MKNKKASHQKLRKLKKKNKKRCRRKLRKLKKKFYYISLDRARDIFQLLVQQASIKESLLDFAEEFRAACFSFETLQEFIKKHEPYYDRLKELKVFL